MRTNACVLVVVTTTMSTLTGNPHKVRLIDSQSVSPVTECDALTIGSTADRARGHRAMWELAGVLSAHGGHAQISASRRIWSSLADQTSV